MRSVFPLVINKIFQSLLGACSFFGCFLLVGFFVQAINRVRVSGGDPGASVGEGGRGWASGRERGRAGASGGEQGRAEASAGERGRAVRAGRARASGREGGDGGRAGASGGDIKTSRTGSIERKY